VDDLEVMMMTKAKRERQPRARRYVHSTASIGYECDDSWVRADYSDGVVWVQKSGYVPLNAGQCRTLAEWLNERAAEMEVERWRAKSTKLPTQSRSRTVIRMESGHRSLRPRATM
jgi:hypothetical protein